MASCLCCREENWLRGSDKQPVFCLQELRSHPLAPLTLQITNSHLQEQWPPSEALWVLSVPTPHQLCPVSGRIFIFGGAQLRLNPKLLRSSEFLSLQELMVMVLCPVPAVLVQSSPLEGSVQWGCTSNPPCLFLSLFLPLKIHSSIFLKTLPYNFSLKCICLQVQELMVKLVKQTVVRRRIFFFFYFFFS